MQLRPICDDANGLSDIFITEHWIFHKYFYVVYRLL